MIHHDYDEENTHHDFDGFTVEWWHCGLVATVSFALLLVMWYVK